jgi:hypothetical protein
MQAAAWTLGAPRETCFRPPRPAFLRADPDPPPAHDDHGRRARRTPSRTAQPDNAGPPSGTQKPAPIEHPEPKHSTIRTHDVVLEHIQQLFLAILRVCRPIPPFAHSCGSSRLSLYPMPRLCHTRRPVASLHMGGCCRARQPGRVILPGVSRPFEHRYLAVTSTTVNCLLSAVASVLFLGKRSPQSQPQRTLSAVAPLGASEMSKAFYVIGTTWVVILAATVLAAGYGW